jgi:hypothetical protein
MLNKDASFVLVLVNLSLFLLGEVFYVIDRTVELLSHYIPVVSLQ